MSPFSLNGKCTGFQKCPRYPASNHGRPTGGPSELSFQDLSAKKVAAPNALSRQANTAGPKPPNAAEKATAT